NPFVWMNMGRKTQKTSRSSSRSPNASGARSSAKSIGWSQVATPSGLDSLFGRGMEAMRQTVRMRRIAVTTAIAAVALTGCGGGKDFANDPRPPVPLQLTGVITKEKVTISPRKVGAGPVVITVSNQTGQSHTLTLDG